MKSVRLYVVGILLQKSVEAALINFDSACNGGSLVSIGYSVSAGFFLVTVVAQLYLTYARTTLLATNATRRRLKLLFASSALLTLAGVSCFVAMIFFSNWASLFGLGFTAFMLMAALHVQ